MLLLVDPAYTAQIYPVCGVVDAENPKTQAVFHCQHCGHDVNQRANLNRCQRRNLNRVRGVTSRNKLGALSQAV